MAHRFAAVIIMLLLTAAPAGAQYHRGHGHYGYSRVPWIGYGGYTAYGAPGYAFMTGGFPAWGAYGSPYIVTSPYVMTAQVPGLSFYSPAVMGGFGMYGTPGYYLPYADPTVVQPNLNALPQAMNPPLWQGAKENFDRWGPNLPDVKPDPTIPPAQPSSPEARLKSLRAIQDGDADMQKQQYLQAYMDYKRAIQAAPDSAQAYFRQGVALTAVQHYDTAIFSFKRALALDPNLPQSMPDLETLLGPDNLIAQNSITLKVTEYARADVRDPDRLFLFGVWLALNHDQRANEVFDTALRLAGHGNHFLAFLRPGGKASGNQAPTPPAPTLLPQAEPNALPLPPPPGPQNSTAPQSGPVLTPQ